MTQIYRLLCAIALSLVMAGVLRPQEHVEISRGTVNIALGDANGMVLLTDSAESYREGNAWHHSWPVQKLFRLDNKTVCSIAGFGSEKGWPEPKMDTYVSGIIANFEDELAKKPVDELDAKMSALTFLVGFYLDVIANRQEVISNPNTPVNPDNYKFELVVAGYDKDRILKFRKSVLSLSPAATADGKKQWRHIISKQEPVTEKGMAHLFGGIPYVSQEILDHPDKFPSSPAIARYARFKAAKNGRPLSLKELAALASEMATRTSQDRRFVGFVGGPDQIAILGDGKIQKLEQPHLPEAPRPLTFGLMVDVKISRALNILAGPGAHLLWIRSDFVGIRNPMLRLDGQFFYGCEIRDSIVQYGGGLTDFGPTNKIVDSMLLPSGGGPDSSSERFSQVANGFPWRFTPPDAPPLTSPPTISPRQPR